MPTYYEILKIQSSATIAEIETALDTQYNQWRRLVTHHNPNVVNQANLSLQTLAQIRSILTDSAKRAVYDAAIGIGSIQVSGLTDPEVVLRDAAPTYLSPSTILPTQAEKPAHFPQNGQRTDAWGCPKCRQANAVGLPFCTKCGNKIGNPCPQCKEMAELINPFCPHCGADKKKVYTEQLSSSIKTLQTVIAREQREIELIERVKSRYLSRWNDEEKRVLRNLRVFPLGGGHSLIMFMIAFGMIGLSAWLLSDIGDYTILLVYWIFALASLIQLAYYFRYLASKPLANKEIDLHRQRISGYEQEIKKLQALVYPD